MLSPGSNGVDPPLESGPIEVSIESGVSGSRGDGDGVLVEADGGGCQEHGIF